MVGHVVVTVIGWIGYCNNDSGSGSDFGSDSLSTLILQGSRMGKGKGVLASS